MTRTEGPHLEIATISRSNWQKTSTFTDDACSGAVTALAMSTNGVYLASASKAGLFVWAVQNRRLVYRYVRQTYLVSFANLSIDSKIH